jgi:AraC family transcriptional regulator
MLPRIEILTEKKFIGRRLLMSFANNKTFELWRSFMQRRKEIRNSIGIELYSLEVYTHGFFNNFNPNTEFEKWAAVEVTDFDFIPEGMETLIVPGGLYAVFIHKGPASEGPRTYNYIFTEWLPNSEYLLDNLPHFAVMGEKYKQDEAGSEEEIWVPVKN